LLRSDVVDAATPSPGEDVLCIDVPACMKPNRFVVQDQIPRTSGIEVDPEEWLRQLSGSETQ